MKRFLDHWDQRERPRASSPVARLLAAGFLSALALILVLIYQSAYAASKISKPPPIPSFYDRVDVRIEDIPNNLTVVWRSGLEMAFPVHATFLYRIDGLVDHVQGMWHFRSECNGYQRIIKREPTAYRLHKSHRWIPYTEKTYRDLSW